MKHRTTTLILAALGTISMAAHGADKGIDNCLASIQKRKAGEVVKVEKIHGEGKTLYEAEIRDANGMEWEFMCDAETGEILEVESEVRSPDSLSFRQGRKLTVEDAAAVALKRYPGVIQEVEYEIEDDGKPTYEFDIVSKDGKEMKVEVDAASGKIIEVWSEEWEIGMESEEHR